MIYVFVHMEKKLNKIALPYTSLDFGVNRIS